MRWERDEEPRAGSPVPGAPVPGGSRIYIVLAVVLILVLGVIAFFALRGKESGTVGLGSVLIGEKVAPFAVPDASSDLDGDANVDPDQACEVDVAGAIRVCDFFDKPLVMSWWFTKGVSGCDDQQDVFDELYRKYEGRVGMLSINVRDDRDKVEDLINEHGWEVPVGHDRDGAVSNAYRVGVCPTFLFIKPGGILKNAEIGTKTLPELEAQVRSLIKASDGTKVKPQNPQQ
jgi:hypothetical protein